MSFLFEVKKKKYCFLHIPKNGGKSIIKNLNNEKIKVSRPLLKHATFLETKKELKEDCHFFCILRNPYSRMVSYFSYIKQKLPEHGQAEALRIAKTEGFSGFINYVTDAKSPEVFRPQKEYISDESGNILEKNITYLRLENIEEDVKNFMEKIELHPKTAYPHTNKSEHPSFKTFYNNEEDKRKVFLFEEEIFKKFKY